MMTTAIRKPLMEPLLTDAEVGQMFGYSAAWARRKAKQGVFPALMIAGTRIMRFRRTSLEEAFAKMERRKPSRAGSLHAESTVGVAA